MTPALHWDAETLRQQLLPLAPGLSVEVVRETGSTNTDLLERARLGDEAPCLRVAEWQTAGRGRQGRPWWAATGASLTFSLGLPYAPADWSGLSLAVGLAVAEALDADGSRIGLKWPNDLWLRGDDRKLCGILIETAQLPQLPQRPAPPDRRVARLAVIGIGINVLPAPAPGEGAPPAELFRTGHACVQDVLPGLDAPAVLHRVARPLLQALRMFEAGGLAPLRSRYERRDVLKGRRVQAGEVLGEVLGIDPGGQLLVQTASCIATVASGEVSVRPC